MPSAFNYSIRGRPLSEVFLKGNSSDYISDYKGVVLTGKLMLMDG